MHALRTTLVIMVVTLVVCSPLIFAAPAATGPNFNYLAMVFTYRSPTPVPPTATPTNAPVPAATATRTPTNTPVPTNTPPPTATPTLPPPTFNNCQADPNPGAAPQYPVRITNIDKVAETVTLQNRSGTAIDVTGWHMCSVTGNQEHPIGGVLAAGASQTYQNTGGPIWNNSTSDPGALYNAGGQLVSYFTS